MDEDQLSDLKQFITVTVSQATAGLATKLDKLDKKVDDLDLKIDTIAETLNETLNDHESRLTKLEQRPEPYVKL